MTRPVDYRTFAGYGFAAMVIAAAIGYAHGPSLSHVHRADHWWYLADISQFDGWWDTVSHTLSYTRTRDVEAGDTTLFRPLLYVLLASQTYLLEHDTRAYQATSLVLHFLVCLTLFRTMRLGCRIVGENAVRSRTLWLLSLAACTYFAVNVASAEAVIWAHLAAYLLFYLVTLGSLNLVLRDGLDQDALRSPGWRLPAVWCAMIFAGFLYEYGQLYAVVLGLLICYFRWETSPLGERVRVAGAFLLIPLICQTANLADRAEHAESIAQDEERSAMFEVFGAPFDREAYEHAYTLARFTLVAPMYPLGWRPSIKSERVHMEMEGFALRRYAPMFRWSHYVGFFAVFSILAICSIRLYRPKARAMIPLVLTLASFVFLFLLGIFAVRVLPRGSGALPGSPYYTYWPNALLLAILVLAVSAHWNGGFARIGASVTIAALLGGTILMSGMTRAVNLELANSVESERNGIAAVAELMEEHPGNFRFVYSSLDRVWKPMNIGVPWPELAFITRHDPDAKQAVLVSGSSARLVRSEEELRLLLTNQEGR